MANMPAELMDLLKDVQASKVLATCDSAGTLNVVPKGSLSPVDEEMIAFAEIMRSAIAINGSFFNAQRMVSQYVKNAYQLGGDSRQIPAFK